MQKLVIASRESVLAMWQAQHVQARLQQLYPDMQISILGMTTQGDQILDRTLSKIGGKGLFVKELEQSLLDGRAHLAVHSVKDVPMVLPEGFTLAAICQRETPYDAFVCPQYRSLSELPAGSVVGTASLRREAQIRAQYPNLQVKPLRGNVQTRLRKLDEGQYDAIILAAAGLKRLGLDERITQVLMPSESLPAVGQGALGIETLSDAHEVQALLAPLHHEQTAACVVAERALARALNGSCQVPLAAYATEAAGVLTLHGLVAHPDGSVVLSANAQAPVAYADTLGRAVAKQLAKDGAHELIAAVLKDMS